MALATAFSSFLSGQALLFLNVTTRRGRRLGVTACLVNPLDFVRSGEVAQQLNLCWLLIRLEFAAES